MKKLLFRTALAAVMFIGFTGCNNSPKTKTDSSEMPATMGAASGKSEALRTDMRKLWEDHVTWTRNVIFCLVDNLPGKDQALERLMKNQEDIGNAVGSFYGEAAGKKMTELLKEHISISAEVVNAAKINDAKALDAASKKWTANADEISTFLSTANPAWKLDDMKMMMHDHLKLTTDEAVARIKKDYPADIVAYDLLHDEILKMSDMISDGIIKQFPDKF